MPGGQDKSDRGSLTRLHSDLHNEAAQPDRVLRVIQLLTKLR